MTFGKQRPQALAQLAPGRHDPRADGANGRERAGGLVGLWQALRRRRDAAASRERAAWALYALAVERARRPELYGDDAVPDTPDGRFELVAAHTALVARRLTGLGAAGAELARLLSEAMMNDMDRSVRELGVGDLSVGKWVRKMAQSLLARMAVLDQAVPGGDVAAVTTMLERNLLPQRPRPGLAPIARALLDFALELERADPADLLAGRWRAGSPGGVLEPASGEA